MSLNLRVWRTVSRQEVVKAHADSQYEWLCTDEEVLDELSYDSLPNKRHKSCPDAIVEAWNMEYVVLHEDWMGKLKGAYAMRSTIGVDMSTLPYKRIKFNHHLRALPYYQTLSTQLLTAITKLADLFAQLAFEQREPSRYCLMGHQSHIVFSLGVSEMNEATSDYKALSVNVNVEG
ncbi:unnamed protein product [Albugo candida]|uniref:Uncharacterized protein n=1 Tax=Albugo candida TaxID=65357 RepID=A0A024FYM2_9STRA|nr:unnamed protein product [Albugo candida]|eukprot:CCI11774.1 unnamed protein product [Albugo candida]